MHRIRRTVLTTAGALALAVAAATPAPAATAPTSGSFTESPETITSARFADGNEFYTLTREAQFVGGYSGLGHADQRIVIHKDGSANVNMTIAFTGTACGQPVVLEFLVTATVDFVANTMTGHYVVKDADGDSGDARGSGTFTGTPGAGGAYEGSIHCD